MPATSWWHRIFGAAADPAQQAGDKLAQLGDRSGVVLASFDGLNGGVGTLDTAFGTLGTGVGGAAHDLDVLGLAAPHRGGVVRIAAVGRGWRRRERHHQRVVGRRRR